MTLLKSAVIGALASVIFFLLFGIPTALISNSFYTRMLPVSALRS